MATRVGEKKSTTSSSRYSKQESSVSSSYRQKQQQMLSLKARFQQVLKDSEVLAYKEIFRTKNFYLKIFWVLLAFSLTVLMIVHTVKTVNNAIQKESFSKIAYLSLDEMAPDTEIKAMICFEYGYGLNYAQLRADHIRSDQLQLLLGEVFPFTENATVAFCRNDAVVIDDNFKRSSDACDYLESRQLVDQIFYSKSLPNNSTSKDNYDAINQMLPIYFNGSKVREFFDKYSLKCQHLFYNCDALDLSHTGSNAIKLFNCCDHFRPVYHYIYGKCWELVISPKILAHKPLSSFQLQIDYSRIDLNHIDQYWGRDRYYEFYPSARYVKNDNSNVLVHIDETGTSVQAWWLSYMRFISGYKYQISLTANQIEDERKKGDHQCIDSKSVKQYMNSNFTDYNLYNCYFENSILAQFFQQNCFFLIFALTNPNLNEAKICTTVTDPPDAIVHCPPICDRLDVSRQIEFFEKSHPGQIDISFIHGKSYVVRTTHDPALDWSEWMGLIGGTLGLWLGYTVTHFVYFAIHSVRNSFVVHLDTVIKKTSKFSNNCSSGNNSINNNYHRNNNNNNNNNPAAEKCLSSTDNILSELV